MGIDDVKPEDIEIVGELEFKEKTKSVEYWQNVAVESRPDLMAIKDRVRIAKKMEDFIKADKKPTVGAFASYEWDDREIPFSGDGQWWTAGLAVQWKLYDGNQTLNKYRAAREMYRKYKHQEKGFEEFIKFKVYEAYQKLQTAKAQLETAKKNVRWAREVLKITEIRYKNQLATMIDLLDTQTLYDKTKFDLAKAIYDAKMALLELKYQAGVLTPETIEKFYQNKKAKKSGGDK
jgi:outer membrane protein TolC